MLHGISFIMFMSGHKISALVALACAISQNAFRITNSQITLKLGCIKSCFAVNIGHSKGLVRVCDRHCEISFKDLATLQALSRVYTIRDATWRDAIWRDIQVLFTLCATSSRAVTWQQGILDPEQMKLGNLNGCFDPTWHCVYLTDIPQKITSIRITQPHKHITWNTNSSHRWVLIKVCWGVNPGCVNSTSHVTLNQAS